MSGLDIFWILLALAAFQPVLRKKMLEAARQKAIARIEKKRGSRVILLVHRQETMSLMGFPVMRYIDLNDSEQIIRAIHLTDPDVPIDIILHTPGGLLFAAVQISRAVRRHGSKVTAFVPHYAMSGGTLIALAADEIVMDEHAVLGPLDPQVGAYPSASLLRVVREKTWDRIDDHTLILADVAEKALAQMRRDIMDLLRGRHDEAKAKEIAEILSQGRWTHDHPISFQEAHAMDIPVRSGMPQEIYQLMGLFPQPLRQQQAVEFRPVPRHRRPEAPGTGNR